MHTDNHQHFDTWWPVIEPIVYQLSVSLVGRQDADDVCQHVALRAFQSTKTFHDMEHVRAWALTVAKNACRDVFRRRKRSREQSLDDDAWSEMSHTHAAPAHRAPRDPETALLTKEEDALLRTSISMLPPRLREAAALYFFEEEPHESVARTLRITEANARKRIQNARSLLRRARQSGFSAASLSKRGRRRSQNHFTTPVVHALCVKQIDGGESDAEIVLRTRDDAIATRAPQRELAHALVAAGELAEAEAVYRLVVAAEGSDAAPWIELASIQRAVGDHAAAAATCMSGAEEVAAPLDRKHLVVLACRASGDDSAALDLARHLVCEAGATAEHWRSLAGILLDAGRPSGAEVAAQHALRLDPRDPMAPSILYDARVQLANFRGAMAAVISAPFVPSIERLLCARLRARHLQDAGDLLQRLPPERARTHAAAAFVAIVHGHLAEAERIIAEFAELHPRHDGARVAHAEVLVALGKIDDALRLLETLPRQANVLRIEARALRAARDPARANVLADHVAARFSNHAALLDAAGMLLLSEQDAQRAREFLQRAIEIEPQWPRLRRHMAQILDAGGETRLAAAILEEWWQSDDHAPFAALQLAASPCAGDARRWAEAALERSDALAFSDPAAAFFCRGEALRLLDRPGKAVIAFSIALQLHVMHPARRRVESAIRNIVASLHSQTRES